MIIKKPKITHELLFVLYYWGFTLLQFFLITFIEYSTWILAIYAITLCTISLLKSPQIDKVLIIPIIFGLILSIDMVFRPNHLIFQYIYELMIYGAIPIYLLSKVENSERLLKIYSYTAVITFILYARDPFIDYAYFGNYMGFGFQLTLPAYLGFHIGRKFLKKKWMLIFEVICLILTIVFANRSILLTIALLWLLSLLMERKKLKKTVVAIIGGGIILVIAFNAQNILVWTIEFLAAQGQDSRTLRSLLRYLQVGDADLLFTGRFTIWERAVTMFQDNVLLGAGTGSFHSVYGTWTHNIILDLLVQYGVIGFVLFSCLLAKAVWGGVKSSAESDKLAAMLFFCMWCPKLFLSTYLFREPGLWCFIAFGIMLSRKRKVSIQDTNQREQVKPLRTIKSESTTVSRARFR